MEHYLVNPYFIRKENEIYPRMTDYFLDFTREFDAVKYGIMDSELWRERWKKQCGSFIEVLLQSSYTGNIILVRKPIENQAAAALRDWCCGYFAKHCTNVIICDDIKTRVNFLRVISDNSFSYQCFTGVEKAGDINQEEIYYRGEYFRSSINNNVMNMMLKIRNAGLRYTEFFRSRNITTIAVYGMGYLGERFVEGLLEEGLDVKFAVDKRVCKSSIIKVISPEENFEKIDAIVVTPVHLFHEIRTSIEAKASGSILSLDEVMDYFIN